MVLMEAAGSIQFSGIYFGLPASLMEGVGRDRVCMIFAILLQCIVWKRW